MALSEKEQELLAQMEAALAAEDPKLASTLRGAGARTLHRRRASLAGLGFLVGIGVLIGGLQVHWAVSVLGFLIMLGSTVLALASWKHINPTDAKPAKGAKPETAFMDRLEERWRRRQGED